MASVLDLVKHYQHTIEKYSNDEHRVLKCIDKLFNLGVTVQHLQETGVGRTVNALRKEPGDVGQAARSLVYKWKLMVAAEESDTETDHNNDPSTHNGHSSGKDSDDNAQHSRSKPNHYDRTESTPKTEKERHKEMNGNYSGGKRKGTSSEDDEPNVKRPKHRSPSEDEYKKKPTVKVKKEQVTESESNDDSDDSESDDSDSEMSESSKEDVKVKHEKKENSHIHKSSSSKHSHSSRTDHKRESSISKKSSEPERHSKHSSSHSKDRHSSEKSISSKEKSHSSDKHKSSKPKGSDSEKKHKSDHNKNSDTEKTHKDTKSSSKHSSSEKHKSSTSHKSDVDKHKSSSDRHSKSEKDKHGSQTEKEKHKSSSEKEISKHKSKDSSSSSSHNSKEKHSSSSKEKSKDRSSSSKEKSNSHNNEKKPAVSENKHKSQSEKIDDKNSEKKSKHKSSSSEHKNGKSSSKTKDNVPKKKPLTNSEDSDDGIDCGSGASFAEALGMISPVKSKKKTLKDVSSPSNDLSAAAMLAPTAKLAPLPAIEISALPEISPNYKPRPPPRPLPHFSDDDAMCVVISSKNQRTKVYSGNKVMGKVPSLYEMCVNILQEHIDALEYTGGVPYEILKPVVDRATAQQLAVLEHYNPYLMEDTDHLWKKFCEKHFRNKQRHEMETWREMFLRCQEEQEIRLKSLTANIRIAQEAKKAPIKQTKMAYVDSVAKPPRSIAKKQALHGTARAATASPAARVASLATASNVLRVGAVRPPTAAPVSVSSFNKPKKAPLMAKALQIMRGRKR